MKTLIAVSLIAILLMLITGCSIGDNPDGAAREWLQAFTSFDGNKLLERTCRAQQQNVQQAGLWTSAFMILGQGIIGQQTKMDISDLRFSTLSRTENEATVRVTGKMRTAVLAFAQEQEVDETLRMTREDGKWKYCGP